MSQKGKSTDQAKMEYIMFLTPIDKEFGKIVQSVIERKVTHIKVSDGIDEKSGGALSKSVSKLKQEDNSQYIGTLNSK